MKVDYIKAAEAISHYYYHSRGVGHTRLMEEGIVNTKTAYHHIYDLRDLTNVSNGYLSGSNLPLAIDHKVLQTLLDGLLDEIDNKHLSKPLTNEQKLQEAKRLLEEIGIETGF